MAFIIVRSRLKVDFYYRPWLRPIKSLWWPNWIAIYIYDFRFIDFFLQLEIKRSRKSGKQRLGFYLLLRRSSSSPTRLRLGFSEAQIYTSVYLYIRVYIFFKNHEFQGKSSEIFVFFLVIQRNRLRLFCEWSNICVLAKLIRAKADFGVMKRVRYSIAWLNPNIVSNSFSFFQWPWILQFVLQTSLMLTLGLWPLIAIFLNWSLISVFDRFFGTFSGIWRILRWLLRLYQQSMVLTLMGSTNLSRLRGSLSLSLISVFMVRFDLIRYIACVYWVWKWVNNWSN